MQMSKNVNFASFPDVLYFLLNEKLKFKLFLQKIEKNYVFLSCLCQHSVQNICTCSKLYNKIAKSHRKSKSKNYGWIN